MAKGETKISIWFYVIILIVGALIGSAIGEAIGAVWKEGPVHDFFVQGINPGLNPPPTLDLKILTITFGFTIKLNVASVIGIIISALLIKRI
jgi:hypothetical protein